MKKVILVFLTIFGVSMLNFTNANEKINNNCAIEEGLMVLMDRYYIDFSHYSNSYGLYFSKNGTCRHWTPSNKYNCRDGEYYVVDQIIYITWDNGQQERVELKYRSDGSAYVYYKGMYYYDGYRSNN